MPTQIDRRDFLRVLGAGTVGLLARNVYAGEGDPAGRRPNVITIVADDLGYADVGFQGCKDIPTPNIDALAASGVRFTNGYVSAPLCSPTRAGIMTGRYQQRFGHEFNPGPTPGEDIGLPLTEVTFADAMRSAGYATGLVGKWHLGAAPKFHPMKRGFQEFYGFLGGAHPYLNLSKDSPQPILRGADPVDEQEYLTDAFAREPVAFIERHRNEPFFLYLTFNAVHGPLQATEKYLGRFKNITDKKRHTYAAMLSAMDDGIGAVLKKLKEAGIEQDTLITFFSDNGGPTPTTTANNAPLRGTKATMYEGGIRVPFIIRWPRRLQAGKVCEHPVISLDALPTAIAAAGGAPPKERPLDGVNLLPYLTGEKNSPPHDVLFWRMGPNEAVRMGNWKLVKQGQGAVGLYDLAADISESKDLAAQNPAKAQELRKALDEWEAGLAQPLWRQAGGQKKPRKRGARKEK